MEDDLIFLENQRWPQFFWKCMTTSIFLRMEDNLNSFENGRQPQLLKMEGDLNSFENGRWDQFFSENGRRPQN